LIKEKLPNCEICQNINGASYIKDAHGNLMGWWDWDQQELYVYYDYPHIESLRERMEFREVPPEDILYKF